jgi:hypothetical protein
VRRSSTLLALLLAVLLASCGGERSFTAEEFVDEINAEGAALELGDVITENQDGLEILEVSFSEPAVTPTGGQAETSAHGAMLVLGDAEEAVDEVVRCESAPASTCFRAANVVVRFEEILPEEQARVTQAFEALASE